MALDPFSPAGYLPRVVPPPVPAPTPRPAPRLIHWPAVAATVAVAVLFVTGVMAWVAGRGAASPTAHATSAPLASDPALGEPRPLPVLFPGPEEGPAGLPTPDEDGPGPRTVPPGWATPAPRPVTEAPAPRARPACETFGTSVEFVANPREAARQAADDHKLLFVLHVSGNFEESQFT
jgi:hypothetical protein